MHVLIPIVIAIIVIPYLVWEGVVYQRRVNAAASKRRIGEEVARHDMEGGRAQ